MNKKRISVVMATAMAASMAAVPMTASADDTVELTFMGWEASRWRHRQFRTVLQSLRSSTRTSR